MLTLRADVFRNSEKLKIDGVITNTFPHSMQVFISLLKNVQNCIAKYTKSGVLIDYNFLSNSRCHASRNKTFSEKLKQR